MSRTKQPIGPVEALKPRMVSQKVLAQITDTSVRTFEGWRLRGVGPRYYCVGDRLIRYDLEEVLDWFRSHPREGKAA